MSTDDGVSTSPPELLFEADPAWLTNPLNGLYYDVAPDDERFLVATNVTGQSPGASDDAPPPPRMVLVNNFFQILEERVPN